MFTFPVHAFTTIVFPLKIYIFHSWYLATELDSHVANSILESILSYSNFTQNDFPPTEYSFHDKGVDPSILTVLILVDGEIYTKPGLCQILILDHGVCNANWSPKHYWKLWDCPL